MNRFKKEKYIEQLYSNRTKKWAFRVHYGETSKTFNETNYADVSVAYKMAIQYRNKILNDGMKVLKCNKKLIDVFYEMEEFSTFSPSTKKKDRIYKDKYLKCDDVLIIDINGALIQESLNKAVFEASDDTLARVLSTWRKIIDYSILKGYIESDPTKLVKLPSSKKITIKKDVEVDDDTISSIKNLLIKHKYDKRIADLYNYAIDIIKLTGCRPSEILALTKKDVHFKAKKDDYDYLYINKELGEDEAHNALIRKCKTPESIRKIPISSKLKEIVSSLIDNSEQDELFFYNGSYIKTNDMGNKITTICKRYNLSFNLYMLRHRATSIWFLNGIDLRTIDELLGHKSKIMSVEYARSNIESKQRAVELL